MDSLNRRFFDILNLMSVSAIVSTVVHPKFKLRWFNVLKTAKYSLDAIKKLVIRAAEQLMYSYIDKGDDGNEHGGSSDTTPDAFFDFNEPEPETYKPVLFMNTSQPATGKEAVTQLNNHLHQLIAQQLMIQLIEHDSFVKDVNLPETEEVEKEIDTEAEQPLEAGPSEDVAESSTVHTSDNVASANLNVCFFCNKKKEQAFATLDEEKLTDQLQEQKYFEFCSIPPCKSELYQQFLRTHYISTVWKNANKKQPTTLDSLEYGWIEQDDKLVFKWFEGDQLPTSVSDLITQVPDSDSMNDEDESHHNRHDSDDDDE
ncbi:unnamed protein product [Psylliodes chrysocephalus]|uniref:Uncharacterized protein n=1 Tax=Psylliodes chrysocephalus TaxID=3402493 RepID=A0A9P0CV12_9CUCU|nr:unnamed protein product [Psylliodes chrysocephala]